MVCFYTATINLLKFKLSVKEKVVIIILAAVFNM